VELPGKKDDNVPVFDTCNEVRRKIGAHLAKTGVTQTGFLRELEKMFHTEPVKLRPSTMQTFRQKHGTDAGNTNKVYYAAYVDFEKERILRDKPKSKMRLEREEAWGAEG
ncbi:hypothetical protein EJ06DRAFT_450999, partial [Trichodelitschia bisporula]